jgi:hypothetical protein
MNLNTFYSPEEIARLIEGEAISKSVKDSQVVSENKNTPLEPVAEAQKPQTFTPSTSVPINSRETVSRPNIRDQAGKRISPDDVVGPSAGIFDHIDEDLREAREAAEAQERAQREIKRVADPANLLNRLNAQHRQIEKMQKEIAALKKGAN